MTSDARHIWSGHVDLLREQKQEGGCPSRVNGETRSHVQGYRLESPAADSPTTPGTPGTVLKLAADGHPRLALTWPRRGAHAPLLSQAKGEERGKR